MKNYLITAFILFIHLPLYAGGNGGVSEIAALTIPELNTLSLLESKDSVEFVTPFERKVLVRGITTEIDLTETQTTHLQNFSNTSLVEVNRLITEGDVDAAIGDLEEKLD